MNASTSIPLATLFVLAAACATPPEANAASLEVRQDGKVGAGTGYRHGGDCLVLTAAHVLSSDSDPASILDRTGASVEGNIVAFDPGNDVALIRFPGTSNVACVDEWDSGEWMAAERFRPTSEFHILREYPNGRESLIALRWAGGSPKTLTLSKVDKVGVQASDSGSLVRFGDKPVGIVLRVDPDTERAEVLRLDVIHSLIGDRFVSIADDLVSLESVKQAGRDNPTWHSYVATWFSAEDAPPLAEAGHPDAACQVSVDVLSMETSSIRNPEAAAARNELTGCRTNLLFRNSRKLVEACESSARQRIESLPSNINVTSVQMQIAVRDENGQIHSALQTRQFSSPRGEGSTRADADHQALRDAFGDIAPPLLQAAGCMKARASAEQAPRKKSFLSRLLGED